MNGHSLPMMFLVSILQTAHLWANTGVVFRELSFSRLECGVHDRLHISPLCGIFYFPWYRHQIEGTNGFYGLIRNTERFTISNVESQVFTPRIILAEPGTRTRAAGVQSVWHVNPAMSLIPLSRSLSFSLSLFLFLSLSSIG